MAETTSDRTPPPPGNTPGGGAALVFLLTVLINFLFIGFVLVRGYPIWIGLVGVVISCGVSAGVLRHLYTGQTASLPGTKALSRMIPIFGRVLVRGVEQVLKEAAPPTGTPKVIPGAVDAAPTSAPTSALVQAPEPTPLSAADGSVTGDGVVPQHVEDEPDSGLTGAEV